MNDESLQALLRDADERFCGTCATGSVSAEAVATIYHRRVAQRRRRMTLGGLAVFLLVAGLTALSWQAEFWPGDESSPAVAASAEDVPVKSTNEPAQGRRIGGDEIARLRAEIAALDAEANRAQRFVELYRAAEARRKRLARADAEVALLANEELASFQIDRAAATTIISADAQANLFHRSAEAAEAYRSTMEHFPESRWAAVAKERLAKIESMN
jgi:hypothetical protein